MNNLELKQEIYKNIQTGVALLDAIKPRWRNIIKKRINNGFCFNMHHFDECVLGHLYKTYYKGLVKITNITIIEYQERRRELLGEFSVSCGFNLPEKYRISSKNYQILTDFWLEELK